MLSEEDKTRLLEGRHDVQALKNPGALIEKPAYGAALALSRDDLAQARTELKEKVAANAQDMSETDSERAALSRALSLAGDYYDYFRQEVNRLFFRLAPGTRLDAEEVRRRQRLYKRYFKVPPADLARQATDNQVEVFTGLKQGLESESDFQALENVDEYGPVVRAAEEALQNLQRETKEDIEATQSLQAAREAFDRVHGSHIRLVESMLYRENRLEDAGRFIRRRDAAYAARRRAKTPIDEELETSEIEAEILQEEDKEPTAV